MRLAHWLFSTILSTCILCALGVLTIMPAHAATSAATAWQSVTALSGSAEARHESGLVEVGGKLYLMGGRGMRAVQSYDPITSVWTDLAPAPQELHHFQPVAVGQSIYVIGSFTCCYPNEPTVSDIHVFNTLTNTWSVEGSMPASRARGSAATVVRDGIIYLVGGNTLGHSGGAVAWFDSYDPVSGDWQVLPDAPNARDHFYGVVVDDFLVAAAGRQTAQPNPFLNAVAQTDLYDFHTGTWTSGDDISTLRAGALAAAAGDEIIVAGGEINTSPTALASVEAMNVYTREWRSLQPLNMGRHSGGGIVFDGNFHVIAGSLNTGGAPETSTHETLAVDTSKTLDFDADGLLNIEERAVYGTDPVLKDTDADNLDDGEEVNQFGTNPLLIDSDGDGLNDGDEVNVWQTDPTADDSDGDGVRDGDEIQNGTNPTIVDTDTDTGSTDGGSTGNQDTGNTDAGNTDAGNTDAGNTDAGNTDAGNTDAGNTDAGNTDAGNTDAGNTDAGNTDAGNTDAGNSDATDDPNFESEPLTSEPAVTPDVGNDADGSITTDLDNGDANDTLTANVSTLLLCALLVGNLSRRRLKRVNVSSKNMNT